MRHFANFIRLTDKTLNKTRELISKPNDTFSKLSGFDYGNLPSALKLHDSLQHKLINKPVFKAATGINPNNLFPADSAQQKTSIMPLVNNGGKINETIEKLVDSVTFPEARNRLPIDTEAILPNTRFEAVLPYVRKKFNDSERLAATDKALRYLPNNDNQTFREIYLDSVKRDTRIKKMDLERVRKTNLEKLQPNATVGDTLRAKLKDRKNYSKAFDWSNDLSGREDTLQKYRSTGLMPR